MQDIHGFTWTESKLQPQGAESYDYSAILRDGTESYIATVVWHVTQITPPGIVANVNWNLITGSGSIVVPGEHLGSVLNTLKAVRYGS